MGRTKISEYGDARAVRFRKNIDKELHLLCMEKEIRISSVIQAAVECFLRNKNCHARKKVLEDLL
jgi:hypothetical protein